MSILKSEGTHFLLSEPYASQFILFTEIRPQAFAYDFERPERDIICNIVDSYYPLQGALVAKTKTGAHEVANATSNNRLIRKLIFMDSADKGLEGICSKTISSTSGRKEADLAYRPLELPQGRSKEWPTFTLQSGYSNSEDVLENNAKWWISASGRNVKVTVTIDIHEIHEQRKEVNIRTYRLQNDGTIGEQLVIVSEDQGGSAHVNSAPLVIPFHDLFLRDPTGNETDNEFDNGDMRHLGKAIWDEQF